MTPPEQNNATLYAAVIWREGQGKTACPDDMALLVIPRLMRAVQFCNESQAPTIEEKVSMLTLWLEGEHEQNVLEGDCTLRDIQASGIALGIACRYADTIIEPLTF